MLYRGLSLSSKCPAFTQMVWISPHSASIHTATQDLSHTASVWLLLARGFYSGDQRTCVAAEEGLKMWPMKAEYIEAKPSLHDYTDKWWGEGTEERLTCSDRERQADREGDQISFWERLCCRALEGERKQRSPLVEHLQAVSLCALSHTCFRAQQVPTRAQILITVYFSFFLTASI